MIDFRLGESLVAAPLIHHWSKEHTSFSPRWPNRREAANPALAVLMVIEKYQFRERGGGRFIIAVPPTHLLKALETGFKAESRGGLRRRSEEEAAI